jgi:hypothetical protein
LDLRGRRGGRLEKRRLHNEELHNLYALPNIIWVIKSRRMRWAVHVARMGEMRNAYNILVGKPEGKRLLGTPEHAWEDNIRMGLTGNGWEGVVWIHVVRDRGQWRQALMNTVMNLQVP